MDFLSRPGRAEIVSKFRAISGNAWKMPSPTPPKSAKVKMRRREFIPTLGGAAATAAWPLAARAQQTMARRAGMLILGNADAQSFGTELREGLRKSGYIEGQNIDALSADQVSRLLKGAKPADLPVQQPTRFELVISLESAKALGLTIARFRPAGGDLVTRRERTLSASRYGS